MDLTRDGYTTYILGAGASANAIPIVKLMDIRLQKYFTILKELQVQLPKLRIDNSKYKFHNYHNFLKEVGIMINNMITHYSIDTYAKKLFLTNNSSSYIRLKHLINSYILFEQFSLAQISNNLNIPISNLYQHEIKDLGSEVNGYLIKLGKTHIESRYDVFLASILNDTITWPKGIKIISYNYDNQIEIAYDFYKSYTSAYKDLNIFIKERHDSLNIIKVNGFATFYDHNISYNNQEAVNCECMKFSEFSILDVISKLYDVFINESETDTFSQINFAWEADKYSINALFAASEIIEYTSNLVIIGYSFPEFNRTCDEKILQKLPSNCKVHVQTTKDTFQTICSRFKQRAKKDFAINEVLFIDQFFIP